MYLLTQSKNGLSAMALGRQLGVSYNTAWLKHKLMQVMKERVQSGRLGHIVQVDDAYLGGETRGGKRGRGAEGQDAVRGGRAGHRRRPAGGVADELRERVPQAGDCGLGPPASASESGCEHRPRVTGGAQLRLSNVLGGTYHAWGQKYAPRYLAELPLQPSLIWFLDSLMSSGPIATVAGTYARPQMVLRPQRSRALYVKRNRIAEIWPNLVSPGWGSDVDPDVKGARKFESFGQRDDARLAAIATTVDFHRLIGFGRVEARIFELAGALKTGVKAEGLRLVTPEDPRLSGGVCIIQVPPQKRQEVFNRLYTQYGIAGAAVQGLRLCPHIYNTMTHIDRAIGAVRDMRSIIG